VTLGVLTVGRVSVDLYPEQAGVSLPDVRTVVPLADWERAFAATRAADGIKFVLDPRL
jgi:hypothetical protein